MNPFKGKYGPLLIAEIGGNHEGDFDYAKKLTQLAIESNVDYIKYQLYTGDTLVNPIENPKRNKHFKKFELTKEQHVEIAEMVKKSGIGYMASVWNKEQLEWIDPYLEIYKIGSGDLTAYPIIKLISSIGKPIILSTGLSNYEEISEVVSFIRKVSGLYESAQNLALLQCTSMYPIKLQEVNLNVMNQLQEKHNVAVGYSDHTEGFDALKYAYAMGAQILEFHFTDDRENKKFRDHKVSLTKQNVFQLQKELKIINTLKGSHEKAPTQSEIDNNHVTSFRRAVYPIKDIPKDKVINEDDLIVLRPNHGIDARDYYKLIGKRTKIDIKTHQKLEWELFK